MNEELIVQYFKNIEKRFDKVDTVLLKLTTKCIAHDNAALVELTKNKVTKQLGFKMVVIVSSVVTCCWAVVGKAVSDALHISWGP